MELNCIPVQLHLSFSIYLIFPQIAKIVKALLERHVIYGNPDEAFGMLPDVKEEIKEEPPEDVEATQVGISEYLNLIRYSRYRVKFYLWSLS